MSLFHRVDDAFAILVKDGRYTQAPLYSRCGLLYAEYQRSFVKLHQNRGTSVPSILWDGISGAGYIEEWNGVTHMEMAP